MPDKPSSRSELGHPGAETLRHTEGALVRGRRRGRVRVRAEQRQVAADDVEQRGEDRVAAADLEGLVDQREAGAGRSGVDVGRGLHPADHRPEDRRRPQALVLIEAVGHPADALIGPALGARRRSQQYGRRAPARAAGRSFRPRAASAPPAPRRRPVRAARDEGTRRGSRRTRASTGWSRSVATAIARSARSAARSG